VRLQRLHQLRQLQSEAQRRETERLSRIDVFAEIGYVPSERQAEFHAATEFDVLYGGAAGGGKSLAIVAEGIRRCVQHPGLRALLVRRTYDELEESIFPALRKLGTADAVGGRYDASKHILSFTNGSMIRFRYLERIEDASRRQGGEYQLLLVDEATLMPPGVVDFIRYERLRSADHVPVIGVRSTCNPGGPSHSEIRTRYIDATDHGEHVALDTNGPAGDDDEPVTIRFIQAKATDNPHLNAGYFRMLDSIPDPQRRAAMRDGSWDVFAGQMFSEFSRERHVVAPFEIGPDWHRRGGLDYGYRHASAAVWAAKDQDSRLWVYRELYESGLGEKELARRLNTGEQVHWDADPAMWNRTGDALPPASVLALEGVPLRKAINDRVIGWQRVHTYLADGPACAHHRAMGWTTCPMVHIFATCTQLIRTLPALPYATKGNPEDANTEADDHLPDAFRYLVMGIGVTPHFIFSDAADVATALDGSELMRDIGGGLALGANAAAFPDRSHEGGTTARSPFVP